MTPTSPMPAYPRTGFIRRNATLPVLGALTGGAVVAAPFALVWLGFKLGRRLA